MNARNNRTRRKPSRATTEKKDDKTQAKKQRRKGNNRKKAKGTAEGAWKGSEGKEEDLENGSEENKCGGKPKQEEERRHMCNWNQRRKPQNMESEKQ